jgi:hypothetical protein
MNPITLNDCQNLYNKFVKYTETAEQHEFALLFQIQTMMEQSLNQWRDPIDQGQAAAMFRVVKKVTGVE